MNKPTEPSITWLAACKVYLACLEARIATLRAAVGNPAATDDDDELDPNVRWHRWLDREPNPELLADCERGAEYLRRRLADPTPPTRPFSRYADVATHAADVLSTGSTSSTLTRLLIEPNIEQEQAEILADRDGIDVEGARVIVRRERDEELRAKFGELESQP